MSEEQIHRRTVIEIEPVFTLMDFAPRFRVKVWQPLSDGWPRKRDKPTAVLGSEQTEQAALEQVRLWLEAGAPNQDEMRARVNEAQS